ncbi:MAG: T9SS type A sorting domain-containing protein, partial [Methanosarcinaceae archaeon]
DTTYTFPSYPIFSSNKLNLQATNTGNIDLIIDSIAINDQELSSDLDYPLTVQPNMTELIPLTFTPLSLESLADTVTIISNNHFGDRDVSINADVRLPLLRFIQGGEVDTVKFRPVRTEELSDSVFCVEHLESQLYQIQIDSCGVIGDNLNDFSCLSTFPFVLGSDDIHQIEMRFEPSAEGVSNATLVFYAEDITVAEIALRGICVENIEPWTDAPIILSDLVTHTIELDYQIGDMDGDCLDLYLEYYLEDTWYNCSLTEEHLHLDPSDYSGTVTWSSDEDINGFYEGMPLRYNVVDHFGSSSYSDTTSISIANLVGDLVYDLPEYVGIDFEDLIPFCDAWKTTGVIDNIGPATGEVPLMCPSDLVTEQVIDFEDLCVFVQMWNWCMDNLSFDKIDTKEVGFHDLLVNSEELEQYQYRITVELSGEARALKVVFPFDEHYYIIKDIRRNEGIENILFLDHLSEDNLCIHLVNMEPSLLQVGQTLFEFVIQVIDWERSTILYDYQTRGIDNQIIREGNNYFEIYPDIVENLFDPVYPNPFSNAMRIRFALKDDSHVNLSIYNLKGQLVQQIVDNDLSGNKIYSYNWNGLSNTSSCENGMYILRLRIGNQTYHRKILLIK